MKKIFAAVIGLIGCVSIAFADDDDETVTLSRTDPSDFGYKLISSTSFVLTNAAACSYYFKGGWTDKLPPHSATDHKVNYYVPTGREICFPVSWAMIVTNAAYNGVNTSVLANKQPFRGDSLTINGKAFIDTSTSSPAYAFHIADLRLGPGGTIYERDYSWVTNSVLFDYAQMGDKLTILGTKANPSVICGSYTGQGFQSWQTLIGSTNAYLRISGNYSATNSKCIPDAYSLFFNMNGDISGYEGTVVVGTNMTLYIKKGMPKGCITIDSTYAHLDLAGANNYTFEFRQLNSTGAGALSIPMTNKLIIASSYFGGPMNLTCLNYTDGQVKIRKLEAGSSTVYINSKKAKMMPNGAIYTKLQGTGAADDPYVVTTSAQMAMLAECSAEGYSLADKYIKFDMTEALTDWRTLIYTTTIDDPVDTKKFIFNDSVDLYNIEVEDNETTRVRNVYLVDMSIPSGTSADKTAFMKPAYTNYYVYMTASDSGTYSWDQIGKWSDKQAPHASKFYTVYPRVVRTTVSAVNMLIQDPAAHGPYTNFVGKSLTFPNKTWLSWSYGDMTLACKDMRFLTGSYIRNATTDENQIQTIDGKLRILTDYDNPLKMIVASAKNHHLVIKSEIVGGTTRGFMGVNTATATDEYTNTVEIVGVASNYYGALIASTNTMLLLGSSLPKGTVETRANGQFSLRGAEGAKIGIGTLRTTAETVLDVPATNTLSIGNLAITGKLTVNSDSTVAFTGTTDLGAGASLEVDGGKGIRVESKEALNGLSVTFTGDTQLHIPLVTTNEAFKATGFYTTSPVIASGTIELCIDLDDNPVPETRTATVNFLTVPNATAATLRDKLVLSTLPWRSSKLALHESSAGGMTTFSVEVLQTGFGVLFQ